MSLRGGRSSRRSNLQLGQEIASGEEQERPRNDILFPLRLLDRFACCGFLCYFLCFCFYCNNRSFLRFSLYSLLFTDYCFFSTAHCLCVFRQNTFAHPFCRSRQPIMMCN